jgi:hypothetical protein
VIGAFAHDDTALAVESAAVPLSSILADDRDRAVPVPAQQPAPFHIDKGYRLVRMPERPFAAAPAGGEHSRLCGYEYVGQVFSHILR